MSDSGSTLIRFLDRIRRQLYRRLLFEGLLDAVAAVFWLFLCGILFFAIGTPPYLIRLLILPPLALLLAWTLFKFFFWPRRIYGRHPRRVALFVESRLKPMRDRLATATEFATGPDHSRFYSAELAGAAVKNVAEELEGTEAGDMVSYRGLRLSGFCALSGFLLLLAVSLIRPSLVGNTWASLSGGRTAGPNGEAADFLAGDIDLTYLYPAYTAMEPLEVKNASGEIEALPGTRVKVRVSSIENFESAQLVAEQGGAIELTPLGERRFEGLLIIGGEDKYHFEFEGNEDSKRHAIIIRKDRDPQVTLDYPPTELEVRETDQIELAFRAEDDFGLESIELLIDYDAGEKREEIRLPVKRLDSGKRNYAGDYLWDLATIRLKAGDRVSYFLEAKDNDSISGPKLGRSATHILKVFSMHEHHRKLIERQEALWETMIEQLAKYLVQKIDDSSFAGVPELLKTYAETAAELNQGLITPLNGLVADMQDDPLATDAVRMLLKGIHQDLSNHREEYLITVEQIEEQQSRGRDQYRWALYHLGDLRDATVRTLERGVIDLYELLKKQKYDALVNESQQLADMRDRMRELLEQYRNTGDEALKKQINKMLDEFRRKLNELMKKMAEITKELPEDFINLEALDTKSMNNDLNAIEKALESGDFEQAMAELEALSMQLNDMLDRMKDGSEALGESMYSEAMKKLMNFQKDLEQILSQEQQLHENTKKQDEEYSKRLGEENREQLKKKMSRQADKIVKAIEELEAVEMPSQGLFDLGTQSLEQSIQSARSRLGDMHRLLETGDLFASLQAGQSALREMESSSERMKQFMPQVEDRQRKKNLHHLGQAGKLTREVMETLEKAMPDPKKMMNTKQQAQMQKMAKQQQQLAGESQRLRRDLNGLMQEMPMMPAESERQMQGAGQGMSRSQGELQQLQPGRARGHQQQAIHNLQQVRQGLEQAMQQMQSGMQFGGMKPVMRGGPGRKLSQEKVAIPQAEDYKAPKALREDILEAMKRKAPKSYEPQNLQYYKELVK